MISRRNVLLGTTAALFAPPAAAEPLYPHQSLMLNCLNGGFGAAPPRTVMLFGGDIAHMTRKSVVYLNRRYGKSTLGDFGRAALRRSFFETNEIADLVAEGHNIVLIDDPDGPS